MYLVYQKSKSKPFGAEKLRVAFIQTVLIE